MKIVLRNLTKRFPNRNKKEGGFVTAVNNFDFEIPDGKLVGLLGPSGCGKSTALNLISGLEKPTEGKIFFGEDDVTGLPPEKRGVGLVFQNYALYPHLTVRQNILFPLQNLRGTERPSKEKMEELALEAARMVQIEAYMERRPSELSGGQQQRVAIARTLAPEPSVLFMDEPLSNLDAKLRLEMRYELQRLHVETGSTFVYVTHDQMEAMTLSTRVCLINNGVLQQYEPPLTVYARPNNLFVADFVGNPSINFIEAKGTQNAAGEFELTILDGKKVKFGGKDVPNFGKWLSDLNAKNEAEAAKLREMAKEKDYVEKNNKDEVFKYHISRVDDEDDAMQEEPVLTDEDFVLGVRPEFIAINDSGKIKGEIYGAMPTGMESTVKIRVGEFLLTGVVFGNTLFQIGSFVNMDFISDSIILFHRKSGRIVGTGRLEVA